MSGKLGGKLAFVTGASAGIGRAAALALAGEGAEIIATGRREEALKSLVAECQALGASARYLAGNLDEEAFIQRLGVETVNVDILVNNAGILNYGPLLDFARCDMEAMFATNVIASIRVAQVIGTHMAARKTGHIIMVTSGAARQVSKYAVIYAATKHALAAITKGLRLELQPLGVKVSEVSPGMVATGIRDNITSAEAVAAIKARTIKALTAEEVADAIVFAATAPSNVMTEMLDVRPQGSP